MYRAMTKLENERLVRRRFLQCAGCGFGSVALQSMLAGVAHASTDPLAIRSPHYAPRARRVLFLFMAGGPSQHDLFVPKERVIRDHGQRVGASGLPSGVQVGTERFLTLGPASTIRPRGQSGATISDLLPHIARVADEL